MAIGHPLPFIDSDALCFQHLWRGGNLAAVPAPSPASVLLHNVDSGYFCQNREMRECRRNAPHIVLRHVRRDGYEYRGFNDFQEACDWASAMLADRFPNAIFGMIPFKINKMITVRSLLNAADRCEEDV